MFLILYQFNHFCQYNCCLFQDVHERFRTESHSESAARFNERFLLSIASCKACVVMDDELNVLPISSHIRSITPVSVAEASFVFHRFSVFCSSYFCCCAIHLQVTVTIGQKYCDFGIFNNWQRVVKLIANYSCFMMNWLLDYWLL